MSKVPRERQRERDVSDYLRLPLLLLLLYYLILVIGPTQVDRY